MIHRHGIQCVVVVGLFAASCYSPPSQDERLAESIVITRFDDGADFEAYDTFFIRPEIRVLDEDNIGDPPEFADSDQADPLLEETRQQLIARGFEEADSMAEADLGVELVYVAFSQSAYFCSYWGDWYYWGYPYGYYYYPYGCATGTWRSGTLATFLFDLEPMPPMGPPGGAPPDAGVPSVIFNGVWASGVYGVELNTASFVVSRARDGIEQAFKQSPYLTNGR